jgi:hypothetical protein
MSNELIRCGFRPRIILVFLLAAGAVCGPAALFAQDSMLFGDLEISGQDGIASNNGTLSALAGAAPNAQLLSGQVKLHANERLTFAGGELSIDDVLAMYQGSDGSVLSNRLIQGYIAITPVPELTFVVGKRRLSWGSGYAFAPGDRIDPQANPGNRSEGFSGLLATLSPSASVTITGAIRMDTAFPALSSLSGFTASNGAGTANGSLPFLSPYLPAAAGNPWARLRYALYSDFLLGNLDTYAAVTYQWNTVLRPAIGFSLDLGGVIANGEVALEISNSYLYPQSNAAGGTYGRPSFGSAYPLATLGLQRTVTTDAGSYSVTVEYLYDGTGYTAQQAGVFYTDLLPALASASVGTASAATASYVTTDASSGAWLSGGNVIPALGRQYAAASLSASVTNLFSASAAALVNLQDGSFAVQPEVRITRLQGVDVFVRAIVGWGRSDRTEFGLLPTPVIVTTGAVAHF